MITTVVKNVPANAGDAEFEQTAGDREGQGSLTCCSPWGRRVEHE